MPLVPVAEIAERLGIEQDYFIPYGIYKGKISLKFYDKIKENKDGKLILVTAMTPTPSGEGKTTVAIGLAMALEKIGKRAIVCLREPSLGPIFGKKGGGTGGGKCCVLPEEDINLHFTGDRHAVASAHNLLASILDNHIHFGNDLEIDEREILFKRTIDLSDRSLRNIVVGLGGKTNGPAREDGFIITPASEVMAILSLATSLADLKSRLCRILVAYDKNLKPIYAGELGACGSMAVLLREALKPNLVQTSENTPAFVHTGCFANIAHGTASLISIKMALKLAEYVVVEAGFGSDLGGEKFVNLFARLGNLPIALACLVATIKALKFHGGAKEKELDKGTVSQLRKGLENLGKHIENLRKMNLPVAVVLNLFPGDKEKEIKIVKGFCDFQEVPFVTFEGYQKGSEGGIELAQVVEKMTAKGDISFTPIYQLTDGVKEKIFKVAREIYGADDVIYTSQAEKDLERINKLNLNNLPICIAKTNLSLSDNPLLFGVPKGFKITISRVVIFSGAGYLVPMAGDINLMPGLPKEPNARRIDLNEKGFIVGLR
ncbi:MAG: formate--tetrahydrofolate ligase [candidate division WOR-3 bacterium]